MAGETVLTIVGNLTADPELRTIQSGASVCNFTIASTQRTFNRQSRQWEDGQVLFMRCTAWRDLAEHCARSLSKGMRVIAQGTLSQETYQSQDGTNRTVVKLTVDEIGPSLKYATAAVARQQSMRGSRNPSPSVYGGWNESSTPTEPAAGGPHDPWSVGGSDANEPEF